MLLAWMAYSVLFGALICAAALAAERVAVTWGRAQRFVWLGALIAVVAVPLLFATRPRILSSAAPAETARAPLAGDTTIDIAVDALGRLPVRETLAGRVSRLVAASNDVVIAAWAIASIVGVALLARATTGLRRRRMLWRSMELDGVSVLVAPNVGPAVVGALNPCVVVPQWSLSLDASARALMLRHEVEHVRARDPLLLFGAVATAALAPWNAALWFIVRRLHLAVELDCDQRVLRGSAQAREYGELLLAVGARLSTPLPFTTALAERRPPLERRIRAMTSIRPRHPRIVSAACVVLVAAATTAAMRSPRPASLVTRPPVVRSTIALPADARTPAVSSSPIATETRPTTLDVRKPTRLVTAVAGPAHRRGPDSLTVEQIRAMIAAHHPTALTGDRDINTITIVVNARGEYVVSLAESRPFDVGGGRGRRGGAGVAFGVGGGVSPGVSGGVGEGVRGRVGGGVSTGASIAGDSAREARIATELTALRAKLAETGGDPAQSIPVQRMRTTTIHGDTIITIDEARAKLELENRLLSLDSATQVVEAKVVGDLVGVNMPALAQLVDPETFDAIKVDVFKAGELGPTPLRVYVVRQKP